MFWTIILWIVTHWMSYFFGSQVPALAPPTPYEISPIGPQSLEEIRIASNALHDDPRDDMRFPNNTDISDSVGTKNLTLRWHGYPGKPEIPYVIHSSVSNLKSLIKKAMDQYHKHTCVKFVERKTQKDYVELKKLKGCWSYVGKINGNQTVSLGKGCEYVGSIVHELGHAIGLYHEQQRTDRNQYITVHMTNVKIDMRPNFVMLPLTEELRYTKYDCDSIMQYGEYAFSNEPGVKKTMVGKKSDCKLKEPYDKPGLTTRDMDLVNKMYKCK